MALLDANRNEPSKKWGDEDDEELEDNGPVIVSEIPQPDGSAIRTIVEYRTNEEGRRVKITRKVRIFKKKIKLNPYVEERKEWKKFGECSLAGPGPERGITSVGEEVFLDVARKGTEVDEKSNKKEASVANLGIVCRTCGKTGDHWTLKCPLKDTTRKLTSEMSRSSSEALPASAASDGKYRPPAARGGSVGGQRDDRDLGGRRGRSDETATIRVTNLSEETKEADLFELFGKFGPIARIFLAKDMRSSLSKGFAFVNFVHREDANRAISKLNGFGYDHLILHLEWAKPSNK